jgi:hypothetical protein
MASQVTITKEDGKLVIIRKPVPFQTTWRERLSNLFLIITIPIFIFLTTIVILFDTTKTTTETVMLFLFDVILIFGSALSIREWLRKQPAPDYYHEILTFDTDKFVVQYCGKITAFAYRFDARPELYSDEIESLDYIRIPCAALEECGIDEFQGGYYDMWIYDRTDVESVLSALKEHLAAIEQKTADCRRQTAAEKR